jgi:hypothetical protein
VSVAVAAGAPPSARALLARRRELRRRSRRWGQDLYAIYLVVLVGGFGAVFGWGVIRQGLEQVTPSAIDAAGPALAALLLLGAARFGRWAGPVSFGPADCAVLLAAPVPRAGLVRPRLAAAGLAAALAGAGVGGVIVAVAAQGRDVGVAGGVACAVACAALGVLAVAASWSVQRSGAVAARLARATPFAVVAIAALAALGFSGGTAQRVGLWSGPWGWALLGGTGRVGGAVAAATAAGVLALAAVAALRGWRRAGGCPVERHAERAALRAGLVAAVGTTDLRTAAVLRRSARDAAGARPRSGSPVGRRWRRRSAELRSARDAAGDAPPAGRRRPPRVAERVPAWHGLLALRRAGGRAPLALLAMTGGAALVVGDQGLVPVAGGALVAYLGAGALLEPARVEVDAPGRAGLLQPWSFGRLLWLHCRLPLAGLSVAAVAGAGLAVAAGAAPPAAAGAAAVLAVPAAGAVVGCALQSARRGGRVPLQVLVAATADPSGGGALISWFALWPGLAVAAVTATALFLGAADTSAAPRVTLILAAVLATAGATLRASLLASGAPER